MKTTTSFAGIPLDHKGQSGDAYLLDKNFLGKLCFYKQIDNSRSKLEVCLNCLMTEHQLQGVTFL